jgi:hypothetical protein
MHLDTSDDMLLSEHIDSEDESLLHTAADSGREKLLNDIAVTIIIAYFYKQTFPNSYIVMYFV